MISFKKLSISDVFLIEPQVFNDERGFFFESFNQNEFENAISKKVNFVQDNHSRSLIGVMRGLHYQKKPFAQAKLVRVVKGEIFDVAVDIRPNSATFGHWIGEFLSEQNKKQLWIPEGFAHGFLTISKIAEVIYKTNNFYNKASEVTIYPLDKDLDIQWPDLNQKIILSMKDSQGIKFKEFCN